MELVLNMLAEASTTEISKEVKPEDFNGNRDVAFSGGNVAKKARVELEKNIMKSVVVADRGDVLGDGGLGLIED